MKYTIESMICRSYGGDSGDWWVESDIVDIPEGKSLDEAHKEHIEALYAKLELPGFVVGIYPYAATEYEDEDEDWDDTEWPGQAPCFGHSYDTWDK